MRAHFCMETPIAYAAGEGIAIHLAPPVLGHVFGVPLTSTMLTAWLTMVLLIALTALLRKKLALIPGKVQVAVELLVGGAFDYISDVLEDKSMAKRYFPLIMTIFVFVLALNWIGLLPGFTAFGLLGENHGAKEIIPFFYPAHTDLNMTIALAIVAFFTIEIAGVISIGFFKYAGKFINFSSPLNFLIGIIELFSELARLISFSFRLFGNIFAGKTLLLIAMFFVPLILPVPILAFELFVGFIQAFIFAVLTLFFIKLATAEPH
jgi:F-type H+-transporting ATPase subunit a